MKTLGIILFTIGVLIQCSIIGTRLKMALSPQIHAASGAETVSWQNIAIFGLILTVVGGATWSKFEPPD